MKNNGILLNQHKIGLKLHNTADKMRLLLLKGIESTNRFAGIANAPKHVAKPREKGNFVEREANIQRQRSESQK